MPTGGVSQVIGSSAIGKLISGWPLTREQSGEAPTLFSVLVSILTANGSARAYTMQTEGVWPCTVHK